MLLTEEGGNTVWCDFPSSIPHYRYRRFQHIVTDQSHLSPFTTHLLAFFGISRPVCKHTPVLRYIPGFTSCDPKPNFGTCRLRAYIRYYCLDSLVSPSDLVPCSSTTQPVHLFPHVPPSMDRSPPSYLVTMWPSHFIPHSYLQTHPLLSL